MNKSKTETYFFILYFFCCIWNKHWKLFKIIHLIETSGGATKTIYMYVDYDFDNHAEL